MIAARAFVTWVLGYLVLGVAALALAAAIVVMAAAGLGVCC